MLVHPYVSIIDLEEQMCDCYRNSNYYLKLYEIDKKRMFSSIMYDENILKSRV
jgi:hypothetical protein